MDRKWSRLSGLHYSSPRTDSFQPLLRGFQPFSLSFHSPLSPSLVAKSVAISSQATEPIGAPHKHHIKEPTTRKTPPQPELRWEFVFRTSRISWTQRGSRSPLVRNPRQVSPYSCYKWVPCQPTVHRGPAPTPQGPLVRSVSQRYGQVHSKVRSASAEQGSSYHLNVIPADLRLQTPQPSWRISAKKKPIEHPPEFFQ